MNKTLALTPIALAVMLTTGCSSDDNSGPEGPRLTEIVISTMGGMKVSNQDVLPQDFPVQYTALAIYSDNSEKDVTELANWTSSDPEILAIDDTSGVATGIDANDQAVTVTATYSGAVNNSTIKVINTTPVEIEIDGAKRTILDITVNYTASIAFDNGQSQEMTNFVDWRISDESVATISTTGYLSPTYPGAFDVIAQYNDASLQSEYAVEIIDAESGDLEAELTLSSESGNTLVAGTSSQLIASLNITKGEESEQFIVTPDINWVHTCDSESIEINNSGLVTAKGVTDNCAVEGTYENNTANFSISDTINIKIIEAQHESVIVSCDNTDTETNTTVFYGEMHT